MGMSISTAFNIFLRQLIRDGKFPFEITLNRHPKAIDEISKDEFGELLERLDHNVYKQPPSQSPSVTALPKGEPSPNHNAPTLGSLSGGAGK